MIRIQQTNFDLDAEISTLRQHNAAAGAIVAFLGTVRDFSANAQVHAMRLEHYPGMTEKVLHGIEAAAHQRWSLQEVLVIHRTGELLAGEQIVLVATISEHRRDAFAACDFIIDHLKTEAPFWKREQTPQGPRWVSAQKNDQTARERWNR
ncbi:molybdenum cofactor biosynthesis protein MoaE [Thermithiobacillus plumbiphilus]|uniref:Molybdopterin synthase catalytic subunit n=1 Tax=Thermithiobacillus plumbiphilus TaxID=1729899 RepID=A0ABU9D7S0_9PROT